MVGRARTSLRYLCSCVAARSTRSPPRAAADEQADAADGEPATDVVFQRAADAWHHHHAHPLHTHTNALTPVLSLILTDTDRIPHPARACLDLSRSESAKQCQDKEPLSLSLLARPCRRKETTSMAGGGDCAQRVAWGFGVGSTLGAIIGAERGGGGLARAPPSALA